MSVRRASTIEGLCDTIISKHKERADEKLAQMIFGLGLPFNIVESTVFIDFVRSLKPAYRLPSRNALSGEILMNYGKIHDAVVDEVEKAQSVCLSVDAWTNIRNESVVGFTATTPKPYFLPAMFPGSTPHTADFYFNETSAMIESIGRSKVTAIVTDNAAAMKAMWDKIECAFTGVICLGCAAH